MSEKKDIAPWWAKGDGRVRSPSAPQSQGESHAHCGRAGARPSRVLRLKSLGLVATLLALLGGGAWWWLGRDGARPSQVEDEWPQSPTATSNAQRTVNHESDHKTRATNNEPPMLTKSSAASISATTNADETVVEHHRTDNGNIHSNVFSAEKPVFNSSTDQLLAAALSSDGGGPPLPGITKADEMRFLESLKKPIEILETDSSDIRVLKERVIQARADMAELLSQGRGFAEVLAEHRKMQEENAAVKREVTDELRSLMEAGDTAAALEYRRRVNAALEQMGIAPLTTAITEEERAERKERRRARRKARLGQ